MKKIISKVLLISMILTSFVTNVSFAKENKIESSLEKQIDNNEIVDVLVDIKDIEKPTTQVDLGKDEKEIVETREKYIEEIKHNTEISQKELLEFLDKNKENGNITNYESFHINNTIHITGKGKTVEKLSEFNNVISINENKTTNLSYETNLYDESELSSNDRWNFSKINADEVYDKYDIKGKNIVIGFIDSGVDYEHNELYENWLGHTEGIACSWYDVFGEKTYPFDGEKSGHGTAVTGVSVGKNTGIAPEANWISARAFKGKTSKDSDILKAAEWMLHPGGKADKAPDIVNCSWGRETSDRWFDKMIASFVSAGIVPVFASGNNTSGNTPFGSIDYPASSLDVIAVGAIDENSEIGYFSKKGPSNLDSTKSVIKPEVVAPGVSIYSSVPGNYYSYWTGTSLAAPNVSGVIALMLQANENLTISDIKNILTLTTTPVKDESNKSPNMTYGYGVVNALRAVELSMSYNDNLVNRIAGENRNETSVKIAEKFYKDVNTVYITNGNAYADGLSMGSLTAIDNGPLLLTDKDNIPNELINILKKLNPSKIVIIGGNNVVSTKVENELRGYSNSIERISGNSRIDTSVEIAKKVRNKNDKNEAFIVNGYNEADSINIVSVSSRDGVPVLFTEKDKLSPQIKNYLVSENIKKATIIGGENTVNDKVIKDLENINVNTTRISGEDRFDTGVKINQNYFSKMNTVFFANGYEVADALSIGPVAGKMGSQIQIIPTNSIPSSVYTLYNGKSVEDYYILGGVNSVSNKNAYSIYELFN